MYLYMNKGINAIILTNLRKEGRILATPGLLIISAYFGFGIVSLALSVVVMKLRKMLE